MITTLDEVCVLAMGQAPIGESYNRRGVGIPLIAGAGDFDGDRPAPTKFTSRPTKICTRGDIVLSIRASIGAKVWADGEYCLGRGVAGLRAGPRLDPHYLWHWLSHNERELAAKGRGATFLQVNRADIGDMSILLPSLAEQRRIAAILDQADALRAKRRQALAHLDELKRSTFIDMFGHPLKNSLRLPASAIGAVAEVVTGSSPPRADPGNFGDDIEWIKSDNLGDDVASVADERLSARGLKLARVAPVNSVLVTCIAGSPASIGKASMVDRDVAFNQQINAILPSRNLEATFLLAQLMAAPELVRDKSTGGMKGLVNKSSFQSIEILVPPIEQQQRFADRFARVRDSSARALVAQARDDELFTSLQSRAFRGEL